MFVIGLSDDPWGRCVLYRPDLGFVVDSVRDRLRVTVAKLLGTHALLDFALAFFALPDEGFNCHKLSFYVAAADSALAP